MFRSRMFRARKFGAPTYTEEATAFFAAHSVQLSDVNKVVVNHCFQYLIDNAVLSTVSALWFPRLVTEQQSLTNWKTPASFRPTAYNFGSSFVPKIGFPANATNETYMTTGWIPATHGGSLYTLNDASVHVIMKDDVQDDGLAIGVNHNGVIALRGRTTFDQATGYINSSSGAAANTNGQGVFSISTTGGASNDIKRNGTLLGNTVNATTALPDGQVFLYAYHNAAIAEDAPDYFIDANTIQCAAIGSSTVNPNALKYVNDYLTANLV